MLIQSQTYVDTVSELCCYIVSKLWCVTFLELCCHNHKLMLLQSKNYAPLLLSQNYAFYNLRIMFLQLQNSVTSYSPKLELSCYSFKSMF